MTLEIFGIVTVLVGLICAWQGTTLSVYALFVSTLFGAAAAVLLPSLGGANIPPAHLLLGFVTLGALMRRRERALVIDALLFPKAGFWLALTILYGALSAWFLPRIFTGATYVFAVARTSFGPGITLVPLGPVSGNITQPVYLVADLVCFVVVHAFGRTPEGFEATVRAALAYALANLIFGALDLATYSTGTSDLLLFMRNANYAMMVDNEVSGLKRIAGSFTEASAYAYATLAAFSFSASLALSDRYRAVAGAIAAASLVALAMTTSTTGYLSLAAVLVLLYASGAIRTMIGTVTAPTLAFLILLPLACVALVLAILLQDTLLFAVQDFYDRAVGQKLASSSGVERTSWNTQALKNFADTWGFGVGVGSVRASSFLTAVPASMGVIGSALYAAFLMQLFGRSPPGVLNDRARDVRRAARVTCIGMLVAASVAGTLVDLGLSFFLFAALATTAPDQPGRRQDETASRHPSPTGAIPVI